MKQIIAIFLFVFAMASCQPKCDCTKCTEECKVEAVDTTLTETPAEVDTLVEETKEEVAE